MELNNSLVKNNSNKPSNIGSALAAREAQEVMASMYVAQEFPRDIAIVEQKILEACTRYELAEVAIYSYPRGGVTVEGPSIRLAEAILQLYGNIDAGTVEVEKREGESVMKSYCIDMETNTRLVKVFTVPHVRYSKANGITKLVDPRDIYEATANYGARRLRSCILGVIPADIIDKAVYACKQTLNTKFDKARYLDSLKKLIEFGATQNMIEKKFGKDIKAFGSQEGIKIITIANSLKDGMAGIFDWFEREVVPQEVAAGNKKKELVKTEKKETKLNAKDVSKLFQK